VENGTKRCKIGAHLQKVVSGVLTKTWKYPALRKNHVTRGTLLTKRRFEFNETPFRWWPYAVSKI